MSTLVEIEQEINLIQGKQSEELPPSAMGDDSYLKSFECVDSDSPDEKEFKKRVQKERILEEYKLDKLQGVYTVPHDVAKKGYLQVTLNWNIPVSLLQQCDFLQHLADSREKADKDDTYNEFKPPSMEHHLVMSDLDISWSVMTIIHRESIRLKHGSTSTSSRITYTSSDVWALKSKYTQIYLIYEACSKLGFLKLLEYLTTVVKALNLKEFGFGKMSIAVLDNEVDPWITFWIQLCWLVWTHPILFKQDVFDCSINHIKDDAECVMRFRHICAKEIITNPVYKRMISIHYKNVYKTFLQDTVISSLIKWVEEEYYCNGIMKSRRVTKPEFGNESKDMFDNMVEGVLPSVDWSMVGKPQEKNRSDIGNKPYMIGVPLYHSDITLSVNSLDIFMLLSTNQLLREFQFMASNHLPWIDIATFPWKSTVEVEEKYKSNYQIYWTGSSVYELMRCTLDPGYTPVLSDLDFFVHHVPCIIDSLSLEPVQEKEPPLNGSTSTCALSATDELKEYVVQTIVDHLLSMSPNLNVYATKVMKPDRKKCIQYQLYQSCNPISLNVCFSSFQHVQTLLAFDFSHCCFSYSGDNFKKAATIIPLDDPRSGSVLSTHTLHGTRMAWDTFRTGVSFCQLYDSTKHAIWKTPLGNMNGDMYSRFFQRLYKFYKRGIQFDPPITLFIEKNMIKQPMSNESPTCHNFEPLPSLSDIYPTDAISKQMNVFVLLSKYKLDITQSNLVTIHHKRSHLTPDIVDSNTLVSSVSPKKARLVR
ncbi:MAG: hypothetical protein Sylvanvirus13_4 [Sylvanvirus sp.]|uniref:Uncharacterized protein n=1 Tax=Sylvanvirus sp. TaxID=2487774 RepID=A0A3G5AI61_9VIRU|nr:MAG: hypothetical protein Sylvanvirus13_4 [Sylvanvirus sp.]